MKYLFITFSVFLSGCRDSPSQDDTIENKTLIGTWISNCYQSYDTPELIWSIAEYHITETEISHLFSNYSDSDCTLLYSGPQNLWEGYQGTYLKLPDVPTTSGVDANWIEVTYSIDPPLPSDIVVEIGLYLNNDELSQVIEDNGFYYIASQPIYFKQQI